MRRMISDIILAAALFAALGINSSAQAAPFFLGLGEPPGGTIVSEADGISADGSVVVGFGVSASGFQAFRWEAGVTQSDASRS